MNYIKMDEPVCPKQHARPVWYAYGAKIFYPEVFCGRMQEPLLDEVR
ncbi:hypothetical protein SAMN05216428_102125 [Nitrosospira sp. Nsp11]|nr:hypothetical protein SAMN05216428_102125 [Nitrosospira sp. Nsp11]